jgi:uncharacterized membrane protein YoaK (UPF0700 family)
MQPLHSRDAVFSRRHLPSWLLLAAAGGAVNAIGLAAHARFVTHLTGAVDRLGLGVGGGWLAFESLVVLGCLMLGATVAALFVGRPSRGEAPRYAFALVAVALMLAALGAMGTAGTFGEFGAEEAMRRNFAFLSVLAFGMGVQNATVASATGLLVRTTHMIGPAMDLGATLGVALRSAGDARRLASRQVALGAGKVAAFSVGVAAGTVLAARVGYLALLAPSAAVLVATLRSFVWRGAPA